MDKLKLMLGMTLGASHLPNLMNSFPKGSTPNKYKPHIGKKQIAKALKNKEQLKPYNLPAPYGNCQFKHCDLRGQCIREGKCHHPIDKE